MPFMTPVGGKIAGPLLKHTKAQPAKLSGLPKASSWFAYMLLLWRILPLNNLKRYVLHIKLFKPFTALRLLYALWI